VDKITEDFIGGMRWTSLSTVINTILQLAQYIILARLLSPEDFGLMNMLMVVITFSKIFSDLGISSAIVYYQNISRHQLSSLYWLNLLAGLIVFSCVLVGRPLVAEFYNEPRLNDLLIFIAFIFLITPFGQQFQFLLQKELSFNKLAKVEIFATISGSITAITLAFLGFGVFSQIWGQLVTNGSKSLYLTLIGWKKWRPQFTIQLKGLGGFLKFGVYQMGSRTVGYFASNIDYLLIGRYLGTEALGIYSLAYQLIVIPVTKINPIVTKVAFPVFSKNQDDNAAIAKGFINMSKLLAFVSFPILIGLIAVADVFVPVVFGEKWEMAIPVVQILSILGILRVLMNPNGSVLLGKGRADLGFKWDFFVAIFNGIGIWLVVKEGILEVATVYVFVSFINFMLGRRLLYYVIQLKSKSYFYALSKPTIISLLMGIFVYSVELLLLEYYQFNPNLFILIGLICFGSIVYISLTFVFDRSLIMNVKKIIYKH
jgi:O-antigen/teichoic acid export membrane protein